MPYHLVNIAFHAANGILIFLILRGLRVPGAWLAAAVWVLHPVNVESVAWITELKNTQSGLFFFLAVLCFLRFEADATRRHWYGLALLCGLAALVSKPSTVVLPFVLLLCAWWQRGRWRRADMARIAPFFLLALAMSALTITEQQGDVLRAGTTEWQLGLAERTVIAGKAIWFYAAKILWPVRLTFVYPRWDVNASSLWSWLPIAALVALAVMVWRCRNRAGCRAVLFGGGFFIVALLPVLGFFDIFYLRYSFVADHFQYLACLGLISLTASAGTAICARAGQSGRGFGTLAAAIVLLILGVSTWRQAHIYQDMETLWTDTLMKNPQCWMAHDNLGNDFLQKGKLSDAIGHFEQALRIKPDYAEARYNLGTALSREGRIPEAIAQYDQALRLKPDYAEAHNNLGIALAQTGKLDDAIPHFEQALRINPDYDQARCNLGNVFLKEGKFAEAIAQYEQELRIKPDLAEVHYNLGIALARVGRVPEAIEHWQQTLRINPDFTPARNALLRLQAK
jgi:tetratricopeptide (TPR) repeat protein